ncbi:MAG: peptidase M23 family protein [Anaerolineaceae bacterium]|nr:MAG: peptidase M23 family protein [Anaerolineaceae bacterium]
MKKISTRIPKKRGHVTQIGKLHECLLKRHSRNSFTSYPQGIREIRVKSLFLLLAAILLAACAQPATATPVPASSPSPLPSSPSPLLTSSPLPPTSTLTPCDPSAADYCLTDGTFLLQRPIAAPANDAVDRAYPYASTAGGTREPHHGVEFPNASGTPVLAAADGTVFYAGDDSSTRFGPWTNFYGNLVVLEHSLASRTIFTLYGHLSIVNVVAGQPVRAGDKIGEVGATGVAIGSHLHFEVRLAPEDYASTLNPELWLALHPGAGVLSIRLADGDGNFVTAPLSVQYFPDAGGAFTQAWQPDVYPDELLIINHWENAALGNLAPGHYRVTFLWEGVWQERWVEVQAGKLTQVEFVMK